MIPSSTSERPAFGASPRHQRSRFLCRGGGRERKEDGGWESPRGREEENSRVPLVSSSRPFGFAFQASITIPTPRVAHFSGACLCIAKTQSNRFSLTDAKLYANIPSGGQKWGSSGARQFKRQSRYPHAHTTPRTPTPSLGPAGDPTGPARTQHGPPTDPKGHIRDRSEERRV